jgi:GT2 family glycosyltransferase
MTPTVTVAIPLHGSARWVENVVANVRALPPVVTEILISDQTCLDDAADRISERLADDARVSVRARPAGLGFVDHYQLLLERATGDLFMWMPHDDIFDPSWVPTLVAALAEFPSAWLAFGRLQWVEADGVTPVPRAHYRLRRGRLRRWSAVQMLLVGRTFHAFRGLFRRRAVLAAGVRMNAETSVTGVDQEWVFTVALRGGIVYDDRTITWKRRYAGSTATTAEWRRQHRGSRAQAAVHLLRQHGPGGLSGLALQARPTLLHAAQLARLEVARRLPAGVKARLKRWLGRP